MQHTTNARPIAALLPFGNGRAEHGSTLNSLCETMGRSIQGSWELFLKTRSDSFYHYSFPCHIGTLKLASTTSTPFMIRRDDVPFGTLMFPTASSTVFKIGQQRLLGACGKSAVFLSGRRREAEAGHSYAAAQIVLERKQMLDVASAMLGPDISNVERILKLDEDRELRLDGQHRQIANVIEQQFSTIDTMLGNPQLLRHLGVDDLLLRSIVMLMAPDRFLTAQDTESKQGCDAVIDQLSQYIDAHLPDRITLTDLERISGYSARSLQMQFKRRFQCSPLEWIRARRLEAAHRQLSNTASRNSIADVALGCGFNHQSQFSAYYRERFGEAPSQTLQRFRAR